MEQPKRGEPLIYSDYFKAAVLAAFPSSERIRLMLAENSFSLGYSLSDGAISSISPALVVSLLEAGKAEVLLRVAKEAQTEIYNERVELRTIKKKKIYWAVVEAACINSSAVLKCSKPYCRYKFIYCSTVIVYGWFADILR